MSQLFEPGTCMFCIVFVCKAVATRRRKKEREGRAGREGEIKRGEGGVYL